MKALARVGALACALGLGVSLRAQADAGTSTDTATAASARAMADAIKLRGDIAGAVLSGETTPEEAIGMLQADFSPSGLKIDPDAGFAFAAFDIGQRLVAARKGVEAEAFFRAAEASLNPVIERTSGSAAREKVQYLQIRAVIRANYLNKLNEARADLGAALQLAPGDRQLSQLHRLITADPATALQNHQEPPSRAESK